MYPNGPISHERHHFVFFLEIEQILKAELDSDEEEDDDEDLPGDHNDTSTENPSADLNNDDDDDDDEDCEFFPPHIVQESTHRVRDLHQCKLQ